MRRRLLASLAIAWLLAGSVVVSACSGSDATPLGETPTIANDAGAFGPTGTPPTPLSPPEVSPTVTATPSPVLLSSGWAVFLRGPDLWIARFDGSSERQLTSGSLAAGYAGVVRARSGEVMLYYTSETAADAADVPGGGGTFTIYRQPIDGGAVQKLFSFHGNGKQVEFAATNATVSPDGLYVAYSDDAGVSIYDLTRSTATPLLTNTHCVDNTPAGCHGYFSPSWSPRGDWLSVEEIFYEGAQLVGVQPLHPAVGVREFTPIYDYASASWSSDGSRLCVVPENGSGAVRVIRPEGGADVDLGSTLGAALSLPDGAHASWCGWSNDGRLAMRYTGFDDQSATHVAVFSGSLSFQQDFALPTPSGGALNATTWLPDGSGLIASDYPHGASALESIVVLLDGTTRSLPFKANRVLGVIP